MTVPVGEERKLLIPMSQEFISVTNLVTFVTKSVTHVTLFVTLFAVQQSRNNLVSSSQQIYHKVTHSPLRHLRDLTHLTIFPPALGVSPLPSLPQKL